MVHYDRQLGLFNPNLPENQPPIVIVGAGTIGSWTTLALAKMGLRNITVVDNDTIEPHNIPNQFYKEHHTKEKVFALRDEVGEYTGTVISSLFQRFNLAAMASANPNNKAILISAVDNMETRKEIFDYAALHPDLVSLLIDARTGGNAIKVYSVMPVFSSVTERYKETLHSDDLSFIQNEEVRALSEVPCTERSIVDVSMVTAGLVCNTVRRFITRGEIIFETIVDMTSVFTITS